MVKPTRASALQTCTVFGASLDQISKPEFRLTGGTSNEISGDSETARWGDCSTQPVDSCAKEGLLGAIKRGEADCAYAFVGGGGISILWANSAEEVNQRLFNSPLGFFYDFEVHPLADYGKFMDTVAEAPEAGRSKSIVRIEECTAVGRRTAFGPCRATDQKGNLP